MKKILDHFEEWLIALLMGAATLIVFVAVVHRYASGWSIPVMQDWLLTWRLSWTTELCIILFVWMAKFGAAYGVRTGIHVGVDVLLNKASPLWQKKLIIFGMCAGAFFTAAIAIFGGKFVWENGAHYAFTQWLGIVNPDLYEGPVTPDLEWRTWVVYSAIPLGSALMCWRFIEVLLAFLKTGELPKHDHAKVEGLDESPTELALSTGGTK